MLKVFEIFIRAHKVAAGPELKPEFIDYLCLNGLLLSLNRTILNWLLTKILHFFIKYKHKYSTKRCLIIDCLFDY